LTRAANLANGELVVGLIERQVRALVDWHAPVLADKDPEPLHQMRVSLRKLRVTLVQFGPLLRLGEPLTCRPLIKTGRRLGLARDLDVLQDRLHQRLLPQLPAAEVELLQPVLRQLRRERQQAHLQACEQLRRSSYLSWLAQMQRWLRHPRLTPLADEPLADWLPQWQLGWLATLFVQPGWRLEQLRKERHREQLHDLRKQIKNARYQLDNCKPLLGRQSRRAISGFKQMQELLGELNDLQVLQQALDDQLPGALASDLPQLHGLLLQGEADCWQQWRTLAQRQNGAQAYQQLLGALQRDRLRARLQRRSMTLYSSLQHAVFCDWRAVLQPR